MRVYKCECVYTNVNACHGSRPPSFATQVSLEILAVYLQAHPNSAVAINLKACNHFRLYNGKAAEVELKGLTDQVRMGRWRMGMRHCVRCGWPPALDIQELLPPDPHPSQGVSVEDSDLLRHNLVVFRR